MQKQLKFDHKYVPSIINGTRRSTIRVGDRSIVVGDRVQVVDKTTSDTPQEWLIPGELHIKAVQSFRLHDIPAGLLHETEVQENDSQDSLIALLRRFYGDSITESTVVSVLSFVFKPYEEPRAFIDTDDHHELVDEAKLFADGGSRGNPGPSAAGFVVKTMDDRPIKKWNKYLGITTNNQAEYHACIAGLEWCLRHNIRTVHVYLDSMLVVNQLKGAYKVKNRDLWALYESAKETSEQLQGVTFTHVPRELNKEADSEVNIALDSVKGEDIVQ